MEDDLFQTCNRAVFCMAILSTNVLFAQVQPAAADQKTPAPAEEKADVTAASAGAAVDPKSYRIGAEDVILLRIWREPELSGLVVVRPDGKINLQLVGEIDAVDTTPIELELRIAKAYEKVLKSPSTISCGFTSQITSCRAIMSCGY